MYPTIWLANNTLLCNCLCLLLSLLLLLNSYSSTRCSSSSPLPLRSRIIVLYATHTHTHTLTPICTATVRHQHFFSSFVLFFPNFFQFGLMLFSQSSGRRQANGTNGHVRHLAPLCTVAIPNPTCVSRVLRSVCVCVCVCVVLWFTLISLGFRICFFSRCSLLFLSKLLNVLNEILNVSMLQIFFTPPTPPCCRYSPIDHNIHNDSFRMGINTYINTDIWILPNPHGGVSSELKMFFSFLSLCLLCILWIYS